MVGFGGLGAVWSDSGGSDRQRNIGTYGVDLLYEIARKFGQHPGLDVAFGPQDPALNIQFGSV